MLVVVRPPLATVTKKSLSPQVCCAITPVALVRTPLALSAQPVGGFVAVQVAATPAGPPLAVNT